MYLNKGNRNYGEIPVPESNYNTLKYEAKQYTVHDLIKDDIPSTNENNQMIKPKNGYNSEFFNNGMKNPYSPFALKSIPYIEWKNDINKGTKSAEYYLNITEIILVLFNREERFIKFCKNLSDKRLVLSSSSSPPPYKNDECRLKIDSFFIINVLLIFEALFSSYKSSENFGYNFLIVIKILSFLGDLVTLLEDGIT